MDKRVHQAYVMLLAGFVLFALGMVIDMAEHGPEFVFSEFRHAPLAHGLPVAGVLVILMGIIRLRLSSR